MKTNINQLKIRLDISEDAVQYYKLQEKWENEGGATINQAVETYLPENQIQLKIGEYFRVLDSRIELIDDEVFYIVDVQKEDVEKFTPSGVLP